MTSLKPVILDIRRQSAYFPYFILLSDDLQAIDSTVLKSVHDAIDKPVDIDEFEVVIDNAQRHCDLINNLRDPSEDFPSAGGIVSKSAFCQLFLSSIDRSDRYAEDAYFMFVSIRNYADILEMDGAYSADFVAAQLGKRIVDIHRQTDIIGQTGKGEFSILLRAPLDNKEPLDAINRFSQALAEEHLVGEPNIGPIEVELSLISIPKCNKMIEHLVTFERIR